MSTLKTVQTITIGWEEFVLPSSMSDGQIILLVGQLAMLERVTSLSSKDYKNSYYYYNGKQTVKISEREVFSSATLADAACTVYNLSILEKEKQEIV